MSGRGVSVYLYAIYLFAVLIGCYLAVMNELPVL